jgi:hypothetical protein
MQSGVSLGRRSGNAALIQVSADKRTQRRDHPFNTYISRNCLSIARIRFAQKGNLARCLAAINAVHPALSAGTIAIDNPDSG